MAVSTIYQDRSIRLKSPSASAQYEHNKAKIAWN